MLCFLQGFFHDWVTLREYKHSGNTIYDYGKNNKNFMSLKKTFHF